jgi:hypothetical protein
VPTPELLACLPQVLLVLLTASALAAKTRCFWSAHRGCNVLAQFWCELLFLSYQFSLFSLCRHVLTRPCNLLKEDSLSVTHPPHLQLLGHHCIEVG